MPLPYPPPQGLFINPAPALSRQPRPGYDDFNGIYRAGYQPYTWGNPDWMVGHEGVDLAAPTGSPVVASRGGTVRTARYAPSEGSGNYVEIFHEDGSGGWYLTRYLHLQTITTLVGRTVAQGETIGTCDTTGGASYPHVHFEIRHSSTSASRWWTTHGSSWGIPYDPLAFGILTAAPVAPKLVTITVERAQLKLGAQERQVMELQAILNIQQRLDPPLVVDGQFGPKTDAAVRGFQADKGLVVDGIVGKDTWTKLLTY